MGVIGLSRARARFQSCAVVVVTALLLCLGIGAAAPASATVPRTDTPLSGIDVTATGGNVLAGGTRSVSVTGSNPTGVDLFNVVGVVLLPVGVAYAAGSAQPAGIGDPTIQTWVPDATDIDPDTGNPYTAQALIWSNIADLPVGSDFSASFSVTADPERYPAGAYFDVGTGLYANSDERAVPDVTIPADGAPVISDATEGGSADARITVLPITISKSETANAEAEVYRGPANPATFELTVRGAPDGAREAAQAAVTLRGVVLGLERGERSAQPLRKSQGAARLVLLLLRQVGQHHVGALAGEGDRSGRSDAGVTAGDERLAALETAGAAVGLLTQVGLRRHLRVQAGAGQRLLRRADHGVALRGVLQGELVGGGGVRVVVRHGVLLMVSGRRAVCAPSSERREQPPSRATADRRVTGRAPPAPPDDEPCDMAPKPRV